MKVVAFGTSTHSKSINKLLAAYAGSLITDAKLEVLDLNDYELPLFSQDIEEQISEPENAHDFLNKIAEADALIISLAEHNGNFSAAWKNLFDWCSRIEKQVFQNTPMVLLSTSPGPRGAATVMEIALAAFPRFGTEIKAHLSVPSFSDNFDIEANELTNPELKAQLLKAVQSF